MRICAACALPAAVRSDLRQMNARGVSLREMSSRLRDDGYLVGKDTLHRCLREHTAPPDDHDRTGDDLGLIVAVIVADVLRFRFNGLADSIAVALHEAGATQAAKIVQTGAVVEMMRTALDDLPAGSPEHLLLEARTLIWAMKCTLVRSDPSVCVDLAGELTRLGADDLAAAVLTLAQRSPQDSPAGGGSSTSVHGEAPAGPHPTQQKESA